MDETMQVVPKTSIKTFKRYSNGIYARTFSKMLELAPSQAVEINVAKKERGYEYKKHLCDIARAEKKGQVVEWDRNKEGTKFYFWIGR